MKKPLHLKRTAAAALALFLLWSAPAHAGTISYEGNFSGLFPEGSELSSFAAIWAISVDGAAPVQGTSGASVQGGDVTSVIYVAKTPSPAGPIPVPYPNTSGPVVVNCDINPGSCVLDPDASDCGNQPDGCVLQSVSLIYSFGALDALLFTGSAPLVLDGAQVIFDFQALFLEGRSLTALVYTLTNVAGEVSEPVFATTRSGNYREMPHVPEPSMFGLLAFGLSGLVVARRARRRA